MLFFTYSYRSLIKRLRSNVLTALAIILFVVGSSAGLGFYLSLKGQLVSSVPKEDILVLAQGTPSEEGSRLDLESARKAALLEGVQQVGNEPLATKETLATLSVDKAPTTIRGFDEMSMQVHKVTMQQGEPPKPNTLDVMVGRQLLRKHPTLTVGSDVYLTGGTGKVTGIFNALGGPMENEIWIARSSLELNLKQKFLSSTTLVATSPAEVPGLVAKMNASKDMKVQAVSMAEFRADKAGLKTILKVVMALLVLLALVATSAIAVTMSAAVVARIPELASMLALGVRRGVVTRIVVVEGLLLSMFGAIIGVVLTAVMRGVLGTVTVGSTSVELTSSLTVTLFGLAIGVAVGLIGSVAPALSVHRLDVIQRLR
ncbi:MAG TPA: FtsX-like permease family protein [Kofleriaceae bacterium]|jgi:ABC-type antimicrobial peptide transport system permease subunit